MRRQYIDYLKAYGCIAIVVLHVISNSLIRITVSDKYYFCLSGMLVLTRWAVPIFIMASGCNLLGRENEFEIAKRHSLHVLKLVLVWGILYEFIDPVIDLLKSRPVADPIDILLHLYQGTAEPLWFCFMIIGLYVLIPIINRIIADKKICQYFLFVATVSATLMPILSEIESSIPLVGVIVSHTRFPNFGVFICYFVLGYYIDRNADFSEKRRRTLYMLSALSVVIMIAYGIICGAYFGKSDALTNPNDITIVILSIGIFVFFKYDFKPGKGYPIIAKIAKESLGIYLMHAYLIMRLFGKGIHALMLHPFLAVPAVSVLVFVLCFAASCLLRKIPGIRNLLL